MGRELISLQPTARDALELLGTHVRVARTERRWTQRELAARVGVSARTIHLIETGAPTPSIGNVFNCCAVLGIRLFGAEPAELARRHADARTITPLLPQRVREAPIDDDF